MDNWPTPQQERERVMADLPGPEEIARRLSQLTRYGGRLWVPVAAHLLACAAYLKAKGHSPRLQLLGLTHDCHEAITGEVPYGFKTFEQALLEDEVQRALLTAWGIDPPTADECAIVKQADGAIAAAEMYCMGDFEVMAEGQAIKNVKCANKEGYSSTRSECWLRNLADLADFC